MPLQHELLEICQQHQLTFIVAINDDGMIMAEAGETPSEGFAAYAPMAIETSRLLAKNGNFGDPLCNALVLTNGRMLILYQTCIAGRVVYLSILCQKVPAGSKSLLEHIAAMISKALGE